MDPNLKVLRNIAIFIVGIPVLMVVLGIVFNHIHPWIVIGIVMISIIVGIVKLTNSINNQIKNQNKEK